MEVRAVQLKCRHQAFGWERTTFILIIIILRSGVWLDNGPCLTRDGETIEFREDSWTYFSNMLYIDQVTNTPICTLSLSITDFNLY